MKTNKKRFNKKLFIVVGHTGAGKTTLCQRLGNDYGIKVIPFSSTAKQFSESIGYYDEKDSILKCYKILGSKVFATLYNEYMLEVFERSLKDDEVVIVEGLYISIIMPELKRKYDVCMEALDVPMSICLKRKLSNSNSRESLEIYKAKEVLKEGLGIDNLIQEADYHINGMLDKNTVFNEASAIFNSFRK